MSLPSPSEFATLHDLGYWIREVFAERGYRVGVGLSADPAFQMGEDPRSTLARALMKEAARIAAAKTGVGIVRGSGGARSIQSFDGNVDRRYRVRLAKTRPDGTFLIETSSDAILELDGDSMYREETWVLGYTLDHDNQIDVLFAAEVLDVIEGTPGHLKLGEVHRIEPNLPKPTGFTPASEGLEGFDDEDGEESARDAT